MTPGEGGLAVALKQGLLVYSWTTQHLQAGCISTATSNGKRVNFIPFPMEVVNVGVCCLQVLFRSAVRR